VRRDVLVHSHVLLDRRRADPHLRVLQKEVGVLRASHQLVRFHNLRDFDVDEVVERVDVLLDQSFRFEKRRQEFPFVLRNLAMSSIHKTQGHTSTDLIDLVNFSGSLSSSKKA
jgi:hypothetical protein